MGEGWVGLGIYRQTDGRGVGWTWNLQTDRWERGGLDLEFTGRQQGWTATGLGFGRQTERHLCRTWDLQTDRWERGGLDLEFTGRQQGWTATGLGFGRQTERDISVGLGFYR